MNVLCRESNRVSSSYPLVFIICGWSILVLCFVVLNSTRKENDDGEGDAWLEDEMTAEQVLENETAGISCQHRFKYWGWEYLPYRGKSKRRSMRLVHPAAFHYLEGVNSAGC